MPKKLIQDIVVRKVSSAPSMPARPMKSEEPISREDFGPPRRPPTLGSPGSTGFWGKKKVIGLVGILAIGIFLFVSSSFAAATVYVTPRQIPVTLAGDAFAAERENDTTHVHFEIMKLEDEGTRVVPSTGTQKVEKKAKGTLIVYNTFDKSPQKLIAGTRFEAPNGKIYKADDPVTIPGMKVENGKEVAGSVTVSVTAAEPGEAYNIGLSDFSIPGFKGTPRYDKFYARSKTEMAGGFVGTTKVARDTDIIDARHTLEEELSVKLLDRAKKEVPEGYLFYEGADFYRVSFPDDVNASATSSDVTVKGKGTLYGMILDEASLAAAIAAKKTDDGSKGLLIANPEALSFSADSPDSFDPSSVKNFTFRLTGSIALEGDLDEAKFAGELAGLPHTQSPDVLKNFSSIERIEVDFSPRWIRSFPKDASRITITRKNKE